MHGHEQTRQCQWANTWPAIKCSGPIPITHLVCVTNFQRHFCILVHRDFSASHFGRTQRVDFFGSLKSFFCLGILWNFSRDNMVASFFKFHFSGFNLFHIVVDRGICCRYCIRNCAEWLPLRLITNKDAHRLIKNNPDLFQTFHTGRRTANLWSVLGHRYACHRHDPISNRTRFVGEFFSVGFLLPFLLLW